MLNGNGFNISKPSKSMSRVVRKKKNDLREEMNEMDDERRDNNVLPVFGDLRYDRNVRKSIQCQEV